MSQRTEKVESLVKQTVAKALLEFLGKEAATTTVTAVEVSPDLKQATVWLGILGDPNLVMEEVAEQRTRIQAQVAAVMTTKYVPKLTFRQDTSGDYAQHIGEIIKKL